MTLVLSSFKENWTSRTIGKKNFQIHCLQLFTILSVSYYFSNPARKLFEAYWFITLVLIFAANHFDDELFYSLSRKKNTFRLFEKSWFIIQMAYWLSTAIRNLQVGVRMHSENPLILSLYNIVYILYFEQWLYKTVEST